MKCETCRFWKKLPLQTRGNDPTPIDTGEFFCGKSRDMTAGIYGQDGKHVITAAFFGCIYHNPKEGA